MLKPELSAVSANPYVDYAKYVRMLDHLEASAERKLEMVKELETIVQSALDALYPEHSFIPPVGDNRSGSNARHAQA